MPIPLRNDSIACPKPTANCSTRMPTHLAARKCPSSCQKITNPNPNTSRTIERMYGQFMRLVFRALFRDPLRKVYHGDTETRRHGDTEKTNSRREKILSGD